MIKFTKGNIINADIEALINTVNCVGIMGKGLALQFKMAFCKEYFIDYQRACKNKKLVPGKVLVWNTHKSVNPKYIINFPTKLDWREKSNYEYIENGLESLKEEIKKLNIRSIAIPPLGCSLGGLKWEKVKNIIIKSLSDFDDVDIFIYEPRDILTPSKYVLTRELKVNMTLARDLFIKFNKSN